MSTRTRKPPKRTIAAKQQTTALDLVDEAIRLRLIGDSARADDARQCAIRVEAGCGDAWADLGCVAVEARRYREASGWFHRVLEIMLPAGEGPRTETDAAEPRESLFLLERIVTAFPRFARGHFSLGAAWEHLGESAPARTHLARALQLRPQLTGPVEALFARIEMLGGNLTDAVAAADRALAADPANYLAHLARGMAYRDLCDMSATAASYRRALAITPDPTLHSCLLFSMNYLAETTPEAVYAEARRWNSLYAAPLAREIRPHTNSPDPERRLKIGYVSPDLFDHTIAKFLTPVFVHLDRSHFELFAYSVGAKDDGVTEQYRGSVENFICFHGSGAELAERIRADGIDVLVDLAGHTMPSEFFLTFARKPAPVQVSWLGSFTTGLATMDYYLGSAQFPCPGTEHLFSETVYRVPGAEACYRPPADTPVAPSPCLARGYITFGSFNNPKKITREVVKLWSSLLQALPGSRLLLQYPCLDAAAIQERFRAWFAERGIGPERLHVGGNTPWVAYLAAYANIDIALDPFPFNGGTTSLDALWMGVPLVTLAGRLAAQRSGVGILSAVGLSEMVAETPEQYLKIALFLAGIVGKAPDLRRNVRRALQLSPLMDEAGVVRGMEAAFRDMWRTWCRKQPC